MLGSCSSLFALFWFTVHRLLQAQLPFDLISLQILSSHNPFQIHSVFLLLILNLGIFVQERVAAYFKRIGKVPNSQCDTISKFYFSLPIIIHTSLGHRSAFQYCVTFQVCKEEMIYTSYFICLESLVSFSNKVIGRLFCLLFKVLLS